MAKKKDEITIRSSAAEYLTYVASVGDQQDSIEMRYEDENIWLTQKMMATLYDVGLPTINEHIKKIYADSELEEAATIRNFRIVQTEGSRQVTRDTKHYSLQMIIAVGFKVNSERAVQFRKWVNQIAKDYTIKGWVMDDERLKRGTYLTEKYFDEQLEVGKWCTVMLRKLNCFLNIIIGSFIGVFIGVGIYKFWHFKTYPNLYAMQSAPWYTELLLYGSMVAVVVVVCIILKLIIGKKLKP